MQRPADITKHFFSKENPTGSTTSSDLKMAGLLLLWLVMEDVCPTLAGAYVVAIFSDNSPTAHWTQQMAAQQSKVAMQLIRALALWLQVTKASLLTPLHITGIHNTMTDILLCSFGSKDKWHCLTDED